MDNQEKNEGWRCFETFWRIVIYRISVILGDGSRGKRAISLKHVFGNGLTEGLLILTFCLFSPVIY